MIEKPEWFDYVVWGYTEDEEDGLIPYIKGLKKGTPKDIQTKFKKDMKEFQDVRREEPDVCLI